MGTTIKDAILVDGLTGKEKLPVSDGSDLPKSATMDQIKVFANEDMATENDLKGKQDSIDDLETIRAGAAKGATALQSVPSEYVTENELTDKGYATTSAMYAALSGKVDKVEGKQLSTEDFTTALKSKLESLSDYDGTEISQAVETLRNDFDTLVSGDATTAIESFNEIVAFLNGIEDSESLDSIIASIEQQIAAKYTKPSTGIPKTDLAEDVQSSLGKADTALQEESFKGTVTSVTAGNGLTGGTITGSGTIALEALTSYSLSFEDAVKKLNPISFSDTLVTLNKKTAYVSIYPTKISCDSYGRIMALGAASSVVSKSITTILEASKTAAGWMSASDKTKLDGIDMTTKQDKIAVVDHGTGDTSFALTPNVFHKWGEVSSLELTLAEPSDSTIYNEYMFEFVSGSTGTTLSLPDTIQWVSTPSIEANKTYQVSIVNNIGLIVSV